MMKEQCIINSLLQRKNDEGVALQDDRISISYSRLLTLIDINSREIINNTEQNIGVLAENTIEFAVAFLSIIYAGKTAIIIKNSKQGQEVIKSCKVQTIFVGKTKMYEDGSVTLLSTILESCEQICNLKSVYKYNDDYVAVIMATSGTTGEGSLVSILYKNLNKRIQYTNMCYPRDDGQRELIVVPVYLTLGNQQQFLTALYLGKHIYIYSGVFLPRIIVELIENKNIDFISLVPTMLGAFISYLEEEKIVSRLKGIYIAGDVLIPELIKKTKIILSKTRIYSAYGMTEIAPICVKKYNNKDDGEDLIGVGYPIKDMQIKIVSNNKNLDVEHEIGEVCIRHEMIESERYSGDGWFHTGDIGCLAKDGELILCGRMKNMLIRNGHNIFPEIIERKILDSKLVREVVVFMEKTKLIANVVVENQNVEKLMNYCRKNLEQPEIPCEFKIVDSIEKNESMKITRIR